MKTPVPLIFMLMIAGMEANVCNYTKLSHGVGAKTISSMQNSLSLVAQSLLDGYPIMKELKNFDSLLYRSQFAAFKFFKSTHDIRGFFRDTWFFFSDFRRKYSSDFITRLFYKKIIYSITLAKSKHRSLTTFIKLICIKAKKFYSTGLLPLYKELEKAEKELKGLHGLH